LGRRGGGIDRFSGRWRPGKSRSHHGAGDGLDFFLAGRAVAGRNHFGVDGFRVRGGSQFVGQSGGAVDYASRSDAGLVGAVVSPHSIDSQSAGIAAIVSHANRSR